MKEYTAYGFRISSEITLPQFVEGYITSAALGHVVIRHKDLNGDHYDAHIDTDCYDFYVRRVPSGDTEVCVSPKKKDLDDSVVMYIEGSVMAAVCHLNDMIPLHAVVIEANSYEGGIRECVAVSGKSSLGKSILAGRMMGTHRVLSDDVAVITVENGIPMVYPSYPYLRLWQTSLESMFPEYEINTLHRVRQSLDKFYVPLEDRYCQEPRRLGLVIGLDGEEEDFEEFLFDRTFKPTSHHSEKLDQVYQTVCEKAVYTSGELHPHFAEVLHDMICAKAGV